MSPVMLPQVVTVSPLLAACGLGLLLALMLLGLLVGSVNDARRARKGRR